MPTPTDTELWQEALEGSSDAFGALFERHAPSVYNLCFRRTGDWALAEDLTSAVFLETWRKRHKVTLWDGSLRPWLLGVAVNWVRNQGRSLRRYENALKRLPRSANTADFSEELTSRLDDERRMVSILQLVTRLPQREQDVLALCVWSELSYEAAAAALNVPVGTVRSRLARARIRIRELAASSGHELSSERSLGRALVADPGVNDER